ncbi:MAG TPA: helix-turn-helix transcriptional regulator [Cellvibrio sp.]|nr:helix-turn-helix transcriptional regulator [Cellvibrio sp.]
MQTQRKYLTPDVSVKAREQLNLSQAKVATETGISRSYLNQFEGSKRVLEDHLLDTLASYYGSKGWKPDATILAKPVEQHISSPEHGLSIIDGFVVSVEASENYVVEDLLGEYYANNQEIEQLMSREFTRGIFGGFIEDEAIKTSLRPLALMARQYEIKRILHGQTENWPSPLAKTSKMIGDVSLIRTSGDYIQVLMVNASERRTMPIVDSE